MKTGIALLLVVACKSGTRETEESCRQAFAELFALCNSQSVERGHRAGRIYFDEDNADNYFQCGKPDLYTGWEQYPTCIETGEGAKLKARLDSYWLQREHPPKVKVKKAPDACDQEIDALNRMQTDQNRWHQTYHEPGVAPPTPDLNVCIRGIRCMKAKQNPVTETWQMEAFCGHPHNLIKSDQPRTPAPWDDVPAPPAPPATPATPATNNANPDAPTTQTPTSVRVSASASSTHEPGAGYSFAASNLIDGNLTTSWQPRDSGNPVWVRLDFGSEVTVTSISIANGFQVKDKLGDEFVLNSRIAKARLRFSDGTELPIQFAADARGLVRFDIPSKRTLLVTLEVDAVHLGTRWHDLAVSEIEVRGEVRAMPTALGVEHSFAVDDDGRMLEGESGVSMTDEERESEQNAVARWRAACCSSTGKCRPDCCAPSGRCADESPKEISGSATTAPAQPSTQQTTESPRQACHRFMDALKDLVKRCRMDDEELMRIASKCDDDDLMFKNKARFYGRCLPAIRKQECSTNAIRITEQECVAIFCFDNPSRCL